MMRTFLLMLAGIVCESLILSGCDKKELEKPAGSEEKGHNELLMEYKFTHNGVSTVDIGESKQLILDFRYFNNAINNKTQGNFAKQLENYHHVIEKELSPTDPALKEKATGLLGDMTARLYELVQSEAVNRKAKKGEAGIMAVSNDEFRMLDPKGIEFGQVIQKILMGALALDKINFFMQKALETDNTKPADGKNYTEMAHCWDIAYGYLGTLDVDPSRLVPLFLANYIEKEAVGMKGLNNINTSIYQAFYKGRKAIGENNTDEVKTQIDFIHEQMGKLFYLRTIYYLRESLAYLERGGTVPPENYFHSMGEALGFIMALPFVKDAAQTEHITFEEAFRLYEELTSSEAGLWDKDRLTGVSEGSISNAIEKVDRYYSSMQKNG